MEQGIVRYLIKSIGYGLILTWWRSPVRIWVVLPIKKPLKSTAYSGFKAFQNPQKTPVFLDVPRLCPLCAQACFSRLLKKPFLSITQQREKPKVQCFNEILSVSSNIKKEAFF